VIVQRLDVYKCKHDRVLEEDVSLWNFLNPELEKRHDYFFIDDSQVSA
jgi:hypothetical protein